MYLVMASYYLAHPNAFECSYIYKNENGLESENRLIRKEESVFQKYIMDRLKQIADEKEKTMQQVLDANKACISLMVGTLLLVLRHRIAGEEANILAHLQKSMNTIIQTIH